MKHKVKQQILFGSVAAIVIVGIALGAYLISNGKNLKPSAAKVLIENYINSNLMAQGSTATVDSIVKENGLYKLMVDIGGAQKVESYATLDGKLFFPQAMKMGESTEDQENADQANASEPVSATVSKKSDKPEVELFVMTHCPYGTQVEKGILPVVAALGNKIDFEIKFNDYAMHGEKELDESLTQYCIQKEQNSKFNEYLTCFLKDSQSAPCLDTAKIDKKKMASCVEKTDKQYSVKENFKNNKDFRGTFPGFNVYKEDNAKYNVGGSPTLIINGEEIQSGRDSASLLKTICSAFNNEPKECETSLSSATPTPGFGEGTTSGGGAAAAGCGQ